MVAGLKFLSKKAFNPQNFSNQKRVWEREQEAKTEARRIQERNAQLQRERDDEELAKARGDTPKLAFLYKPPPGAEADAKAPLPQDEMKPPPAPTEAASKSSNIFDRQPGDDDAAAAFRQLLAASTNQENGDKDENETIGTASALGQTGRQKFGVVLQGSKQDDNNDEKKNNNKLSSLSALEKAVGRRNVGPVGTLEEQIQKFPALANAPRQKGLDESVVGVTFKPLGTQIRNVRCFACGIWGHSKGDRECQATGWDPFAVAAKPMGPAPTLPAAEAGVTGSSAPDKEHKNASSKSQQQSRPKEDDSFDSDSSAYEERRKQRKRDRKRNRKHHDLSDDEEERRERRRHKKYSRRRRRDEGDKNNSSDDSDRKKRSKRHHSDDDGRRRERHYRKEKKRRYSDEEEEEGYCSASKRKSYYDSREGRRDEDGHGRRRSRSPAPAPVH